MSLQSPPFCPHCSEPLSPNVGYCPRCGKDVFGAPAPAPAPVEPAEIGIETVEVVETDPAPPAHRRRRTALLAVGAVAAVAVGGAAWALRGDGDHGDYWSDVLGRPGAVATTPGLAWTWEAGDDVQQVATAGPTTYVVTARGVTSLDADGDAAWTSDLPPDAFVHVPPGDADYLLAVAMQDGVIVAHDADDGSERWTVAAGTFVEAVGDHVVVADAGTIRSLDAGTGREEWSADMDSGVGIGPGAVYVVAEDRLRRLDLESGREDWSRPFEHAEGDLFGPITVADGFVVAAGSDAVRAFDSDDGSDRWTADLDVSTNGHGPGVGLLTRSRVYLWAPGREQAEVYDGQGRSGSLPTDLDGFYAFPVHGPDGDLAVTSDGAVYDADLERVGSTTPDVTAVTGTGVYAATGGVLSFTPFGAAEAAWELDLRLRDSDWVTAGDGRVVVSDGWAVSAYR